MNHNIGSQINYQISRKCHNSFAISANQSNDSAQSKTREGPLQVASLIKILKLDYSLVTVPTKVQGLSVIV